MNSFFPRGGLIRLDQGGPERVDGQKLNRREKFVAEMMRGFMSFHPCIGARTLAKSDGGFIALQGDMTSARSALVCLDNLAEYLELTDEIDTPFKTLIFVFMSGSFAEQIEFERVYWRFVQKLHDIDGCVSGWDSSVSNDIDSENFELSLCGRAVFTTTLNPVNPRLARRCTYPVWVVNQTRQFDDLRAAGKFEGWKQSIRNWDAEFDPSESSNPALGDHGDQSSTSQLAGSNNIRCPLKVNRGHDEKKSAIDRQIEEAIKKGEDQWVIERLCEKRDLL